MTTITDTEIQKMAADNGICTKGIPSHKLKDIVMKRLIELGVATKTGRYFIKTAWDVDERKLRQILGPLGIRIEPEYNIDLGKSKTDNIADFVARVKSVVEQTGKKFDKDRFLTKVKSRNLETAIEEYFGD